MYYFLLTSNGNLLLYRNKVILVGFTTPWLLWFFLPVDLFYTQKRVELEEEIKRLWGIIYIFVYHVIGVVNFLVHSGSWEAVCSIWSIQSNECWSLCVPRKKAVLIGLHYSHTTKELHGCRLDVQTIQRFLIKTCHFLPSSILMLTGNFRTS